MPSITDASRPSLPADSIPLSKPPIQGLASTLGSSAQLTPRNSISGQPIQVGSNARADLPPRTALTKNSAKHEISYDANSALNEGTAPGLDLFLSEASIKKLQPIIGELIECKEALVNIKKFTEDLFKKLNPVAASSYSQAQTSVTSCIEKLGDYYLCTNGILEFIGKIPPEFQAKKELTAKSSLLKTLWNQVPSRKILGLGETAVGMILKNFAWYMPLVLVPSKNVHFSDVGAMSKLISLRALIGTCGAAMLEYPFVTHGQKVYIEEKGAPNDWAAFAQAFDNISAGAILYAIGQLTKSPLSKFDLAGFAGAAAAATIQAGAFENFFKKMFKKNEVNQNSIEANLATPAQASDAQNVQNVSSDTDLERANPPRPVGANARKEAKLLTGLPESIATKSISEMEPILEKAFKKIKEISDIVQSDHSESMIETPPPIKATKDGLKGLEENIEYMYSKLSNIDLNKIPEETKTSVKDTLHLLQETKNQLEKDGGAEPSAKAFFATTTLMFAAGLVIGNLGPALNSKELSNISNRAIILAVTSSIAQAFANLGQFLGGATADDSSLIKFLKIGQDNPDSSAKMRALQGWGRAVRFLPVEFIPLQMANVFAEQALHHANKVPEAVASIFPSIGNIRNWQEAARAVMTIAFTKFALGDQPSLFQKIGVGANVASATAMCLWQARSAGKLKSD